MKTESSWGYRIANAASHALHIAIIVFVAIGWLIPALQLPHLLLIASTLACWFVLGFWFGFGYCPITDWHWKIKDKWGQGRPQTSYIHSGLEYLLCKSLSAQYIDLVVGAGTLVIAIIAMIKYFFI